MRQQLGFWVDQLDDNLELYTVWSWIDLFLGFWFLDHGDVKETGQCRLNLLNMLERTYMQAAVRKHWPGKVETSTPRLDFHIKTPLPHQTLWQATCPQEWLHGLLFTSPGIARIFVRIRSIVTFTNERRFVVVSVDDCNIPSKLLTVAVNHHLQDHKFISPIRMLDLLIIKVLYSLQARLCQPKFMKGRQGRCFLKRRRIPSLVHLHLHKFWHARTAFLSINRLVLLEFDGKRVKIV